MKKALFVFILVLQVSNAYAGQCGAGKVERILMGGFNSDDLIVQIDYSVSNSTHSSTEFNGYVRFKTDSLSEQRLERIFSMVLSAYHSGSVIYTNSHNNNCSDATEVSLR